MKRWVSYLGIGMGLLFVTTGAQGYFADKYWCHVEPKTISVSLSSGDVLCMTYLSGFTTQIEQLDRDLESAIHYSKVTKDDDQVYRLEVVDRLTIKKNALTKAHQELVSAIQDFEQELFVRVKGIVGYYLLPYTIQLEDKIGQGKILLQRLLHTGNTQQYIFVRHQLDSWEDEMILLDRMQEARIFDTLLPPLKQWFTLQETK